MSCRLPLFSGSEDSQKFCFILLRVGSRHFPLGTSFVLTIVFVTYSLTKMHILRYVVLPPVCLFRTGRPCVLFLSLSPPQTNSPPESHLSVRGVNWRAFAQYPKIPYDAFKFWDNGLVFLIRKPGPYSVQSFRSPPLYALPFCQRLLVAPRQSPFYDRRLKFNLVGTDRSFFHLYVSPPLGLRFQEGAHHHLSPGSFYVSISSAEGRPQLKSSATVQPWFFFPPKCCFVRGPFPLLGNVSSRPFQFFFFL